MRIAFAPAARLLSDTEANGESLIAVALLRALAARGHDLVAYCERSEVEIPGVDIREVSAHGATAGFGRIAFARRIAREAARDRYDIVHLLFPFTTDDGYTLANGAPLVCGPVNLPWPRAHRRRGVAARAVSALTDRVERSLHARTLARAARVLVTGERPRAAMAHVSEARCVDIPFGVDLARFAPVPLPDDPVILFLSVLQERKGLEVLLAAMQHVARRIPRARLLVAGADPHGIRSHMERRAEELGIAHTVDFLGAVLPSDAPATYARARVLCQPSFGEPFGMTVIEAMACGLPVVATASGGIPDAVVDGKGGRLVPAGDARLLADALTSVLERRDDSERMAAFNRARAERRYALEVVVDRIELTYRAVLAGHEGHVAA